MKCVMVINEDLPVGLMANTAAVLAISVGKVVDGIVGDDVYDQDMHIHHGITRLTIPLLKGSGDLIKNLRNRIIKEETNGLYYVDFCDVAQKSKTYSEYKKKMESTSSESLSYLGIALYGPKKLVNQYTGSMALLK